MHIKGVYTALITPFLENGDLDKEGLVELIQRQIDYKIDGILLLGTTGESPTITPEERRAIITLGRKIIPKSTCFMVGTGSNSTTHTIELTREAKDLGADAALVVSPYYNRPTQEGLYQHYAALAKSVDLPLVVYNIQARTGQNIATDTLRKLSDIPSIVGVKEASGNLSQISEVIELMRKLRPDFSVMSGDDSLILPVMALGGVGVYSVISNLMPFHVKFLVELIENNEYENARKMFYDMMPLIRTMFIETNPSPLKAAMNLSDLPAGPCRLPLSPLTEENHKKLQQIFESRGNEILGCDYLSVK